MLLTFEHMFAHMHTDLEQSAVVGEAVLPIPAGIIYLIPPAGQQQLIGAVKRGRVDGVAVDQADQVLPVVLPGYIMLTQSC